MKDSLKYIALAIIAYLIYQRIYGQQTAAAASPLAIPPAPTPASTPPVTTTTAAPSTRDLLMMAAGNPTAQSFHQWNYFYRQVRNGANPPEPSAVGQGDGNAAISVDQYLSAIAGIGLNGWRQ